MSRTSAAGVEERESYRLLLVTTLVCAAGAAMALFGHPLLFIVALLCAAGYLLLTLISIREPLILAGTLLLALEVLPPFYLTSTGETPIYASFFAFPIFLAVVLLRFPDIYWEWDPISRGLLAFLIGTATSIPFAFWLSGFGAATQSLSRWILLSHTALVYWLIRGCTNKDSSSAEQKILRLLVAGAVISAAYGIVDFVWPIPLSHPAADQFIWLEGAVVRRAQGVFYESSSFANFCGFFLIAASCAFAGRKERMLGFPRSLLVVFISILSLAVLVSFSRSTWASILVALFVSLLLSRVVRLSRGLAVACALVIPLLLLWAFSPGLWEYLVSGRIGRLFEILDDPNSATSGRVETWIRVLSILRENPQYLLFGVGYKTLPVTRLFHGEIVTDNGYLSLLLETGAIGLTAFLLWSSAILRVFYRLARSAQEIPAFWGTVLFSIWCGELVQLLAADALTYWRNISIVTALMALTLNLAVRSGQKAEPL
jgi:hypothetical protein